MTGKLYENKVEVHIPGRMGSEKLAMEKAAEVARSMGFSDDRIEDLKTAVAEACLNAMEHGNKLSDDTAVAVTLRAGESSLEVAVEDSGKGVEKIPEPDIEAKMEGKDKTRGWGVFLIERLMDEVSFEKAPEGGSVVRMIIHLERGTDQ